MSRKLYVGHLRGFALVEMSTAAEARQAIAALPEHQFERRSLTGNEARPKPAQTSGRFSRLQMGGTRVSSKMARPASPRGMLTAGRIVRLLVGQGHGFVRQRGGREVYFHRADLQEGVSFNDFRVGDDVAFELFEDAISGPRALRMGPLSR